MANPFDQFTTDFQAALPPTNKPPGNDPPPFSNQPPPPPPMMGGYGDMSSGQYGAPPPPPQQSFGGYNSQSPGPPMSPPPMPSQGPPPPGGDTSFGGGYGQPPSPAQDANPFGAPSEGMYGGPPPPPQPDNIYGSPPPPPQPDNMYGGPPPPQSDGANMYGGGFTQPDNSNTYGTPPPSSGPPPSYADPWGGGSVGGGGSVSQQPPSYDQGNPYGGPPPSSDGPPQPDQANPFGAPPPGPPDYNASYSTDPASQGALVPSQNQSNPYAGYGGYGQQQPSYGQPPQGQHPYGQQSNPYGPPPGAYGGGYGAPPPPPPAANVDPFSVFEAQSASPQIQQQQQQQQAAPQTSMSTALVPSQPSNAIVSDDDFFGSFSVNSTPAPAPDAAASNDNSQALVPRDEEEKKGDDGLPPGGEWYDARIFTPTLGVMFFKPQELTDSLFLNTDKSLIDALGERPVVAFIVEGSSARSAGVELGHVLLKVNGVDVKSPKEASRMIKEGPRPLPLLFYVPNTDVVTAEGEHMVKYDTRETLAPNSAKEWKPKYVVVGGIIAQPWMINMYRSKSEYDIAVIETQARRAVSVKVKQFSLQGARIQNDWQGPQMVKYKNKLHPWKYIVVLPVARNPIKISSPSLASLKPVHEGIRRVLLTQQRDRPTRDSHASPPRNDYRESNRGGDDNYQRGSGGGGGGHADNYRHQNGHSEPHQGGGGYAQQPQQQAAYRY